MKTSAKTPLVVISVVGMTPGLLGACTPNLNRLARDGFLAPMDPVFPAVTSTAHATMLTASMPAEHGVVANGWYFRDLDQVKFWVQPNCNIQGEKVWHRASREIENFTSAQLFWWYNMHADVDWAVTPRPMYPADGRKIPGLYSQPAGLERSLQEKLGPFPFFNFWGPMADLRSSAWIAECAKEVFDRYRPTLQLVYLPHLDYNLQRLGPDNPAIWEDVRAIDAVAGKLIDHVRSAGADVIVVSEYGIEQVDNCIHINRLLREHGYLAVREELDWEMLDCGASRAFAVADHQVAHVHIRHPADVAAVAEMLRGVRGIEHVLGSREKAEWRIDHPRSGELVLVASPRSWFTYYYWLDDARAPDFARTVDIHRKPGYDPAELFFDPCLRLPALRSAWRVLQKTLGFRMLMDVVPLDASLVKGSHGRLTTDPKEGPLVMGSRAELGRERFLMTGISDLIMRHWVT